MNSKGSHKLRGMGDVDAVMKAASSLQDAAKRLRVNYSTVHRWVRSGKVPAPGGTREPIGPKVGQSAEQWANQVRAARELDATESTLLDLAVKALALAAEGNHPMVRLAAMSRFQGLVKQLRLDAPAKPEGEKPEAPTVRAPVRRVTHDPRKILQAVK